MISEGEKAPEVALLLPDGTSVRPGDYLGRVLVLYFYPKDDTTGCTREAQDFTALAPEFAALDATVLGVSKDTGARHQKFIAKYDLKVGLATDADGSVCEAFGAWIEKSLYGRKYMGIDRSTFLIDRNGKVARIWRKVKVAGHVQQVLDAVRALG